MAQKLRPQAETLSGSPQPNFVGYQSACIIAKRAPTTLDTGYPLGQLWVDKINAASYQLQKVAAGVATWALLGTDTGALNTLTGDSGGAISPSAGNITLSGTASQITTTGSGSSITYSLPNILIVPGSLEVTSGFTIDAGAVTVNSGTAAINISADAAATTVNVATGAAVKALTLGSTNSTSATTVQSGSGALAITSTNGTLTANSGTGALGISTDAAATTISIGTGAAVVKTISIGGTGANVIAIGNTQTTGSVAIGNALTSGTVTVGGTAGTGTITIGQATNATGQSVLINSGASIAGTNIVGILAGATPAASQTLNVMTGVGTAGTYAVNILTGNSTGTTQTVAVGTGSARTDITLGGTGANVIAIGNTQTTGSIALGNALTSGTIALGGTAGTGAITLGQATNATGQTVSIASGTSNAGANIVNILNGTTPAANTTLNVMCGAGSAGTQTFNLLATGATRAGAVNIGTGAAAHITTIGSTTASNSVNFQFAAGQGISFNAGVRMMSGANTPNGAITAPAGSFYMQTNPAGATSRLYVNTDSGTTWTNITCAA